MSAEDVAAQGRQVRDDYAAVARWLYELKDDLATGDDWARRRVPEIQKALDALGRLCRCHHDSGCGEIFQCKDRSDFEYLRAAARKVLEWWPENSENNPRWKDVYGHGFGADLRELRRILSAQPTPVKEGE